MMGGLLEQPMQQGGQPIKRTEAPRDYASNPLGPEDKDDLDEFVIMATSLIHSPETRNKVLNRIQKKEHPFKEIAKASLVVMDRIESEDRAKPWDKAVAVLGLVNITSQISDLAVASNKVEAPISPEDKKMIFAESMSGYIKKKISSGEITKEEAAKLAHQGALNQSPQGQDGDVQSRLKATQGLQSAPKQATNNPQGMQAPAPATNPMNPETTMKEALATGQGGLLNG